MRRLIAIVAVVLIPAFITGCSSGTGTTTPLSLVGTWNLTTVNNSPLPLILLPPNPRVELLSNQIVVLPDGTFTESYSVLVTEANGQASTSTVTNPGTWTLSGNAVTLLYNGTGATATGFLSATSLTFVGAISLVYLRL